MELAKAQVALHARGNNPANDEVESGNKAAKYVQCHVAVAAVTLHALGKLIGRPDGSRMALPFAEGLSPRWRAHGKATG